MSYLDQNSDQRETKLAARRRWGRASRFSFVCLPAALVTTGLFYGMQAATHVDYVEPDDAEERVIEAFTYVEPKIDPPKTKEPFKAPVSSPPPPVPKYVLSNQTVEFSPIVIRGEVPKELIVGPIGVIPIKFNPNDRIAVPLIQPIASYPTRALDRNLEGDCDVTLDVDPKGQPFNVDASCTDRVCERAAEVAVTKAKFAPRIVNGQPVIQKRVIYPLEFRFQAD